MVSISNSSDLIALLKSALFGTEATVGVQTDWARILYLSQIHTVGSVVYSAIEKNHLSDKMPDAIFEKFRNEFLKSVLRCEKEEAALCEVSAALEEEHIRHIFFKGAEIRQLYPAPALRIMGDIDLIVEKKDRNRAVRQFEKLGYELTVDYGSVWNLEKRTNRNLVFELHTDIVYENNVRQTLTSYFSDPMRFGIFEGGYRGHFSTDFHLIYLLVHLAKHFYDSGAGIRLIADIAVYLDRLRGDINFDNVFAQMKQLDLLLFTQTIFALCNFWFGIDAPGGDEAVCDEAFLKQMSLNIINHGIFGLYGKHRAANFSRRKLMDGGTVKKSGRVKTMFRLLFPTYEALCSMVYMKFVRGKKFLIPYAWVYRWVYCAFHSRKESASLFLGLADKNLAALSQKEADFLKQLGI